MPHELALALRALSRAHAQLDALTAELHGRTPAGTALAEALLRARHRGQQLAAVLGDPVSRATPLSLLETMRAAADAFPRPLFDVTLQSTGGDAARVLSENERVAVACLVTAALSNEARHGESDAVVVRARVVRAGGEVGVLVQPADASATGELVPWDHPSAPLRAGFGLRAAAGRARSAGGSMLVAAAGDGVAIAIELGPEQARAESARQVLSARANAALTLLQAHGAVSILAELRPLLPRPDAQALSAVLRTVHAASDGCLLATQPRRSSR